MDASASKEELEAAHCWEADDRVPRRPEMTDFRRRLRYHQAQWREAHGHPVGSQPIAPRLGGRGAVRLVGNRLPLDYARQTGANSDSADACARYRDLLADPSTFASVTIEELLDAAGLPARTAAALRERYIPG